MKKLFCILLIIPIFSVAGLNVDKVTKTLSNIKSAKTLNFFNANKSIDLKNKLKLTSFQDANIILFPKKNVSKKMTIVDSYKALQLNKNSIGAIYLKKGRTQIIFIDERLKKNGLSLTDDYNKNLLSECQINPICLLTDIE